jgi:2-phosphosulfolactate phosphatase
MKFHRATLATCTEATGAVVVIDVLRAFSTAAYAFAAGAQDILLTRSVEEAIALRQRFPGSLIMGEVGGLPVIDFDFSNSPAQLAGYDLSGCRLIQRTSSGTQGMVLSCNAEALFAGSFICARATARSILDEAPQQVTFVITGAMAGQQFNGAPLPAGDEDAACADYLEMLLQGIDPDPEPYLKRVLHSTAAMKFASPDQPDFPEIDLEYCTALDRFDFAMRGRHREDLLILEKIK